MPRYDYRCPDNGEVIEVRHRMDEQVTTWGELCEMAGRDPGDTPGATPVERIISGSSVVNSGALRNPEPSSCCSGGVCGL